jgi:hypothetical protein
VWLMGVSRRDARAARQFSKFAVHAGGRFLGAIPRKRLHQACQIVVKGPHTSGQAGSLGCGGCINRFVNCMISIYLRSTPRLGSNVSPRSPTQGASEGSDRPELSGGRAASPKSCMSSSGWVHVWTLASASADD